MINKRFDIASRICLAAVDLDETDMEGHAEKSGRLHELAAEIAGERAQDLYPEGDE